LFERVRAQAGFGGVDVEKAVPAVLATLGQFLTPDEVAPLVAELPEPLAQLLHPAVRPAPLTLDGVYAAVAERASLSRPHALEMTQVVCQALGASLDPDARSRLAAHLGPLFERLFEPRPEPPPPSRPVHAAEPPPLGEGHTLATGRPGSHHPLSEAHPESGQTPR
jgi:uncharacterized protein (DUF2267 family)